MIRAYIGRMGEGKTLSLIKDSIEYLNDGINVFTNIPFVNLTKVKKGKAKQPVILKTKQIEEALLQEKNCLFAVDEGNIVFPAHYWKNLSPDYEMLFAFSRKLGVDIFYTSQLFTHTVSRLRDLTQEILRTTKRRFFSHHFFINKCYDPERFRTDFSNPFQEKNALLWERKIYWWEAEKIYKMYNTKEILEISTAYQGKVASKIKEGTSFAPVEKEKTDIFVSNGEGTNSITTLAPVFNFKEWERSFDYDRHD